MRPRLRLRLALGLLVAGLLVLLHPLWLAAMGDFLVARDPLGQADAIIVLAGNSPYRVQHAVELYKEGWAPRLLVSNELVFSHGIELSWVQLRQAGLVKLEVPDEAIIPLEEIARSTHHEAVESRDLMLERGWRRAILVTDPFHTRRAVMAFRSVWQPAGLEILASPADGSKHRVEHWWRDPNRANKVIQEYVKFPYYLLAGQL